MYKGEDNIRYATEMLWFFKGKEKFKEDCLHPPLFTKEQLLYHLKV